MRALTFSLGWRRLVAAKVLGWFSPAGFLSRLGPVRLADVPEPALPGPDWVRVATRRAGSRLFVDLHMHMPGQWSLARAAALRTSVEQALMSAVPGLRATIQLLPMDVEAHFDDPKDPL